MVMGGGGEHNYSTDLGWVRSELDGATVGVRSGDATTAVVVL